MDVIYGLIPMMLLFGFLVVVVFIWMAKSGQFDDLDGAANRIFMDDDFPEERPNGAQKTQQAGSDAQTDASDATKADTQAQSLEQNAKN
ncbi:cbb3-type cytochrome oxidase assembly protein CcoS [Thiomicrorhabdus cannonii]|uniref:cbb3-type cytochrome oxidase assembly protein CcoS n=1 Tax=Thiomicrorhabdus cannonii TaxID=2748011 RepID=UPI001FEA609E|nr:cbb3-type cytochrome oxidase assembly protein CcoS [Thiomicrorhabdus cannonii]